MTSKKQDKYERDPFMVSSIFYAVTTLIYRYGRARNYDVSANMARTQEDGGPGVYPRHLLKLSTITLMQFSGI